MVRQRSAKPPSPVQVRMPPFCLLLNAGVAEMVDARDLKSLGAIAPCRFKSGLRQLECFGIR